MSLSLCVFESLCVCARATRPFRYLHTHTDFSTRACIHTCKCTCICLYLCMCVCMYVVLFVDRDAGIKQARALTNEVDAMHLFQSNKKRARDRRHD